MAKFEIVKNEFKKFPEENITLPVRSTANAAGYDFFSPTEVDIYPGTQQLIMTDVKAKLAANQVLMLYVRSSYGIKKNLMLANGTGIIDADYYENPGNDGNIGICLYNYSRVPVHIEKGDRIAQGIIMTFDTTEDDNTNTKRQGGFGSTGI